MGHGAAKDCYARLAGSLDRLTTRAPCNEAFLAILAGLYSRDEAEIISRMPAGLSTLDILVRITGIPGPRLRKTLEKAADKGLVIDLNLHGSWHYAPSPFVIGLFEFTMMRTGQGCDYRKWAGLFRDYLGGSDVFYRANCSDRHQVAPMRTMPHEEAAADYVEVLDYERARQVVERGDRFALGVCSCRHEKHHLGRKQCSVPLANCTSMGMAADYLVRHRMAREADKPEILEILAQSRELGLVFNADNVRRNVSFICHCCSCCCNALAGITTWGYANTVVSSTLIAESFADECTGCGVCAGVCPISSITMQGERDAPSGKAGQRPVIDRDFCLGCGVCALRCPTGAMRLVKRRKRVIHPENTFARVILSTLERGTLQHQLFTDPGRFSHRLLRGLVGGFCLLPPVKKALMSDLLRSRFLKALEKGAKARGQGWMTEI